MPSPSSTPRTERAPRRRTNAPKGRRWRFWAVLVLLLPIVALSPAVQLQFGYAVTLPGAAWLVIGLTALAFAYGGQPFLKGAVGEWKARRPGRMTLSLFGLAIALGLAVLAALGATEVFSPSEAVLLLLVMLLGHLAERRTTRTRTAPFANAPPTPMQRRAERSALGLTLGALLLSLLVFAGWSLLSDRGAAFGGVRALAVLVTAAPHLYPIAVSLALKTAAVWGARRGVYVRHPDAFEKTRGLDAVVFGKTGLLTDGRCRVTDVLAPPSLPTEAVLRLAAAAEAGIAHPIAEGIRRAAEARDLAYPRATGAEMIPGRGVRAQVDEHTVEVLGATAARETGLAAPFDETAQLEAEGKTVVWVARDGQAVGALALAEALRPDSTTAVEALHRMGLQVLLRTGDREAPAERVATALGIDRVFSDVRPEDRNGLMRALKAEGRTAALYSEHIADAEAALTLAPAAAPDADAADVTFAEASPFGAVQTLRLARTVHRKTGRSLSLSAGYHLAALPLAAGAATSAGLLLSPLAGAALASLLSVLTLVYAKTLRMP